MRFKKIIWVVALLLINTQLLFAQGDPCGGSEPDGSACPLDTYVWLIAIVAVVFGTLYLYRREKEFNRA